MCYPLYFTFWRWRRRPADSTLDSEAILLDTLRRFNGWNQNRDGYSPITDKSTDDTNSENDYPVHNPTDPDEESSQRLSNFFDGYRAPTPPPATQSYVPVAISGKDLGARGLHRDHLHNNPLPESSRAHGAPTNERSDEEVASNPNNDTGDVHRSQDLDGLLLKTVQTPVVKPDQGSEVTTDGPFESSEHPSATLALDNALKRLFGDLAQKMIKVRRLADGRWAATVLVNEKILVSEEYGYSEEEAREAASNAAVKELQRQFPHEPVFRTA